MPKQRIWIAHGHLVRRSIVHGPKRQMIICRPRGAANCQQRGFERFTLCRRVRQVPRLQLLAWRPTRAVGLGQAPGSLAPAGIHWCLPAWPTLGGNKLGSRTSGATTTQSPVRCLPSRPSRPFLPSGLCPPLPFLPLFHPPLSPLYLRFSVTPCFILSAAHYLSLASIAALVFLASSCLQTLSAWACAMYITSDLFGSPPAHRREHDSTPKLRTSATQELYPAGLGKRKRQTGDESPSRYNALLRGTHGPKHVVSSNLYETHDRPSASTFQERRPMKQLKRSTPKITLNKSTSHLMDLALDSPDIPARILCDLRSCHACNLAPKRRAELENYLDCQRCDGRTCFICARECVGGCGKAVCKRCIVEVGQEGDSWCLECYSRNINS